MNIKIIVNPQAGKGKAKKLAYEVENFLCGRGLEYSLDRTFRPMGAATLARKAVEDGFDLVLSVGGDGTANEVANGLAGSRTRLAVIPAGTKNDFARSLGLDPEDLISACETAVEGRSRKIDLGLINGRYFLNGVSLGLKTELAKQGIEGSGPIALMDKVSQALFFFRRFKPLRVVITADSSVIDSSVISVQVANGRYLFGGRLVAPKASLEDGLLDLAVIKSGGKLRYLANRSKIKKGCGRYADDLISMRASKVDIECPLDTYAKFDGELIKSSGTCSIRVSDSKLNVMSN